MIEIERRVTMTVKDYMNDHKEDIDLFTSALTKAHADAHPEVKAVRELYVKIQYKIDVDIKDIDHEFETLKRITNNYEIPDDVCGTYEKTYQLLKEANRLYNEGRAV
ncbi:iron-sulfur cluster repair di-iron protein, ric [Erysipelothrix rhusiopathiae]|uniref:iron-sulfur cluster repair di-iron protein, ric n=2 Tax=Erysipelothrix rhusiopathiae TaxID=1648 RepID=UPI002972E058|nr:iron-sulfur cluster repair di-iron protein, ric [Erysipelothrix rhusiopathiae]